MTCLSLEITLKYMFVRCAIVKLHCYKVFRMFPFPHSAKQHTFVIQKLTYYFDIFKMQDPGEGGDNTPFCADYISRIWSHV